MIGFTQVVSIDSSSLTCGGYVGRIAINQLFAFELIGAEKLKGIRLHEFGELRVVVAPKRDDLLVFVDTDGVRNCAFVAQHSSTA